MDSSDGLSDLLTIERFFNSFSLSAVGNVTTGILTNFLDAACAVSGG